ncbi:isocitrate lyase/phosphoenolpyruvate mutase family protein [Deinococcus sp. 6GRE01]|uniref:isocitrate lyase/PEP mutase family protein n=1 Tax=Deinococcus sp. 6GRE01 TaxID=2745873 RepID=UPI001E5A87B3|nr:isocitrate lyase/phosphoenolpyruvate mutase family protein [Deinococcus sp. 6GRE01]MCD0158587.1 isocitrate lyase/phosphoenolpyruvate mutase family protein [Deinococcus sp. 6GRE01]
MTQFRTQPQHAHLLRALHERGLILPCAWDAVSARALQQAGSPAIGTSSAAVAFALGFPDGQVAPRDTLLAALERTLNAVTVPVTADLEGGYADTPQGVADTVRAALSLGAAGLNLEDATGQPDRPLLPVDQQVDRLRAARAAADALGIPAYLNARTDTYLSGYGDTDADRLDETVRRGRAYLRAGADSVFVPGLSDLGTLRTLRDRLGGPLAVIHAPGGPDAHTLLRAGASRVSTGPSLFLAALGHAATLSAQFRERGTLDTPGALPFGTVQGWFSRSPA